MTELTAPLAETFISLVLRHLGREYPYKMDHVLTGPSDAVVPRTAHPVFFGSFDWHSCVHGYWLIARLVRRFPWVRQADMVKSVFRERFTAESVAGELAYIMRPAARAFERPYGWGWLLALQGELELHEEKEISEAAKVLRPLTNAIATRWKDFLQLSDYPVRTGVHSSTAFAMRMAADWCEAFDPDLYSEMQTKALNWYGADQDCQAWEPSQDDFLSPALIEAECMRRLLEPAACRSWLERFLPRARHGEPLTLFTPARVSDRTDGKIAHLDGLNFSRAWCWRSLATLFPDDHPAALRARAAADEHIRVSLPHVAGDYMGEHWLATFALLALEAPRSGCAEDHEVHAGVSGGGEPQ